MARFAVVGHDGEESQPGHVVGGGGREEAAFLVLG